MHLTRIRLRLLGWKEPSLRYRAIPLPPFQRRGTAWVPGVPVVLALLVSYYWRERATLPLRFILSPSAALRVAGLASRVKVEHTTV